MRHIRAGLLREPVFLGRPQVAQDAAGAPAVTWQELKTFAAIEPVTGREFLGAGLLKDAVDVKITVRISLGWEPDARWRVRDAVSGRIYNIVSALLMPKEKAAECLARSASGNSDGR